MNGIFCIQLTSSDAIEEALIPFKSRKVPFMLWIGSAAQSADWESNWKITVWFIMRISHYGR